MYVRTISDIDDEDEEWFIFEDDGCGMDISDMENYLTLLNTSRNSDENMQHGKYSFGGKQAILQLSGLTTCCQKSDRAIIISKKKSQIPVCCEFVMRDLINSGWTNTIKPFQAIDKSLPSSVRNNFKKTARFSKTDFSGTTIFIKMTNQLKKIFTDEFDAVKYQTSINFFRRLDVCKYWIGPEFKSMECILAHDPLHIDKINTKYYKIMTIEHYIDSEKKNYFVCNGEYLPFFNAKGHVRSHFISFDATDQHEKQSNFTVELSMIYGLIRDEKLKEYSSEKDIYLCRNGVVIGTFPAFKIPIHRTAHNENISRWCRMRININSTNLLDDPLDNIFGVNMNKGIIVFKSLPKNLQKSLKIMFNDFCRSLRKNMLEDFPPEQTKLIKIEPELKKIKPELTPELAKITYSMPVPEPTPVQDSSKITEKSVQEKLHKREGGRKEVAINGRYIDLLTDEYIIEIKNYDQRLDSLKILYYHSHFPDHKARIHLFNEFGLGCPKDPIFEKVCEKHTIKLTYE